MHIPDGILPLQVSLTGFAISAGIIWFCVRKIKQKKDPREDIPKASLLTAAFFVASLIHIPLPLGSVHLVLSGLMGAILGYFAFLAVFIGLFLQAIMFGHGGLTTLGVNAVIIGVPALLAWFIFRLRAWSRWSETKSSAFFGFLAGGAAIGLSTTLFALVLTTNIPAYMSAAAEQAAILTLIAVHIPLMFIEGIITASLIIFLCRVNPGVLQSL